VPGPPGQVLLQSFNHVPQNARDPAADARSLVNTGIDSIVANTNHPNPSSRNASSIETGKFECNPVIVSQRVQFANISRANWPKESAQGAAR